MQQVGLQSFKPMAFPQNVSRKPQFGEHSSLYYSPSAERTCLNPENESKSTRRVFSTREILCFLYPEQKHRIRPEVDPKDSQAAIYKALFGKTSPGRNAHIIASQAIRKQHPDFFTAIPTADLRELGSMNDLCEAFPTLELKPVENPKIHFGQNRLLAYA